MDSETVPTRPGTTMKKRETSRQSHSSRIKRGRKGSPDL
jgi:hypothetical protein